MDKITCLAYLLYESSKNPDIQEKAVQLLNGDVTIRDLKKNGLLQTHVVFAESMFKKKKIDKIRVRRFAEEFMTIEI